MAQARTLLTGEDLLRLSSKDELCRYELEMGKLKQMPPAGGSHSELTMDPGAMVRAHVRPWHLGHVVAELGFYLHRDQDTVRAPDIAFVRAERVPSGKLPEGFSPARPTWR
ncbi:MAG: hypothetical protein FJ315_00380 [SAR202 cluster bacterium]|nr:hypothetical protein [SAR202 cluster bacterium]